MYLIDIIHSERLSIRSLYNEVSEFFLLSKYSHYFEPRSKDIIGCLVLQLLWILLAMT